MEGISGLILFVVVIIGLFILMRQLRKRGIGGQLTGASNEPLFSKAPTLTSRIIALGLSLLFGVVALFFPVKLWFAGLSLFLAVLLFLYGIGISAPLMWVQSLFSR